MMASIVLTDIDHCSGIAVLAGQPDIEKFWLSGNVLFVADVTQESLKQAQAQYSPFQSMKTQTIEKNNSLFEQAMLALTADYPPSEISSWERQRAEALAWQADNAAPTPWIDIAAQVRGVPRAEYLQRTVAKVQLFAQASAFLVGRRQAIDDAIRRATAMAELEAIRIDYTLPGESWQVLKG